MQKTNNVLKEFESALKLLLQDIGTQSSLNKSLEYMLSGGGKRIRPMLFLNAYEMFNGSIDKRALDFACAIECLHTYTLVHDDLPCMDDDDYRRGKLSCHKAFNEGVAVLCGDALLNLCFELILRHAEDKNFLKAAQYFAHCTGIFGLIKGQAEDIDQNIRGLEQLYQMFEDKTGKLLTASVYCGAVCGGADEDSLKIIEEFGKAFGFAFQLYDDIGEKASPRPNTITYYMNETNAKELLAQKLDYALKILNKLHNKNISFFIELVNSLKIK